MTLNGIGSFDTNHKIKQLIDAIECQTTNGLETETIKDLYEYINTHFHLPNPIVEQMSDTFQVLVMDDEGYITYIDDQFCKKIGYQKEELLQHHYRILHAGVHQPDFYQEMWDTIRKGKTWTGDICTQAKSGEIFWFRTNIIPIADDLGNYTSYLVFRTDISDVKYVDKHLIESLEGDYRKLFSQLMNLTF